MQGSQSQSPGRAVTRKRRNTYLTPRGHPGQCCGLIKHFPAVDLVSQALTQLGVEGKSFLETQVNSALGCLLRLPPCLPALPVTITFPQKSLGSPWITGATAAALGELGQGVQSLASGLAEGTSKSVLGLTFSTVRGHL